MVIADPTQNCWASRFEYADKEYHVEKCPPCFLFSGFPVKVCFFLYCFVKHAKLNYIARTSIDIVIIFLVSSLLLFADTVI